VNFVGEVGGIEDVVEIGLSGAVVSVVADDKVEEVAKVVVESVFGVSTSKREVLVRLIFVGSGVGGVVADSCSACCPPGDA
jgi:hypothetical protein